MRDQLIVVVNEISYLEVTVESTEGWNKHKMKPVLSSYWQVFSQNTWYEGKLLKNVYEVVYELRLMYGAETWDYVRGGRRLMHFMGDCKKICSEWCCCIGTGKGW
jgi:hypothetical protein